MKKNMFVLSLLSFFLSTQAAPAINFANQACKPEWSVQYVPTANDCTKRGDIKKAVNNKLECSANFGCCHCALMTCGTAANPTCNDLVCNGDSSCYGAGLIQLFGNKLQGASLDCNGDLSCMQTNIVGRNINQIKCSGDGACAFSTIEATCVSKGCMIQCVGDNACEGSRYVSPGVSFFNIENSAGLSCAVSSCRYGFFNLPSDVGGDIVCNAISSCEFARVNMVNTRSLQCGGPDSCANAIINIKDPQPNFYVNCNSAKACFGLTLRISVTDPRIETLGYIACAGASSCEGLRVMVTKTPPSSTLTFGPVMCQSPGACTSAAFSLGANVQSSCQCTGGPTFCQGVVGLQC